jgi:hypothetical protein
MRINIQNLGLIKQAELVIKPLTILVGPNNTGKTWLAYTLASIFGPWGLQNYLEKDDREGETSEHFELLDKVIARVLETGSASFDLVEFAKKYGEQYFNAVASFSAKRIFDFIGAPEDSINNLKIEINLGETASEFLENLLNTRMSGHIGSRQDKPLLSFRKVYGKKRLNFVISKQYISLSRSAEEIGEEIPSNIVDEVSPDIIGEVVTQSSLTLIHRALYNHAWILPTERTTYITFPFPGLRVDEGIVVTRSEMEVREVKLVDPVESFLEMISDTVENETQIYRRRLQNAKNDATTARYLELASLLEKRVLEGEVIFSQQTLEIPPDATLLEPSPARQVLFQPTADCKLPISVASSMVKELSSLVLYLRYLAEPGEMLVIDEPEMNLHPEAQAKMIEFLALLVNSGLKVLITTHSPYIVDHLTNLIKAHKSDDPERLRELFYLKQSDAFLSQDRVSVYLVDQGKATNVMDEDGILDLHTFGEVSERISDIFFQL